MLPQQVLVLTLPMTSTKVATRFTADTRRMLRINSQNALRVALQKG